MGVVPIRVVDTSVYVTADVNGHPVLFIIDTGDAIGPVFNSNDAHRLGLRPLSQFEVSGAGGSSTSYKTKASVRLGEETFEDEPCAIDPYLQGASLLGLPFFLRKCDQLTFDFMNSQLVMSKANGPETVTPADLQAAHAGYQDGHGYQASEGA